MYLYISSYTLMIYLVYKKIQMDDLKKTKIT